ncbi:Dual specificity phosphatase, catalytic domain containing protein [Coccidioides posadasii C735 delta SOWgp]|uniref:Dual specificity phosphatase, catalytic domain containing protein n=1 Tax=Coccidioides posadasii (strain C735) TaxID=222929 RepID=C5P1G7_COCP7|nr:Dual specificity phosphatase, catalytic domain containing protein [Coccidioides posadasii C735 delta SOWgp]EER29525.1 Dual specificity phosphatase, catalytic domain containing protein [Coccidioides posadasii C735 delta SOWgp]|eukprot:XP_003071670.1 Dual specificity phosphatase, catalytic domain containing protein [Coccidioides posadasii C735 delta SOWgp]
MEMNSIFSISPFLSSPIYHAVCSTREKAYLSWDSIVDLIAQCTFSKFYSVISGKGSLDDRASLALLSWVSSIALIALGSGVIYRQIHGRSRKKSFRNGDNRPPYSTNRARESTESSSEDDTFEDDERGLSPFDTIICDDDKDHDPGLLKKHSSNVSYTTSIATYPSIRTFFCPHPHIEKLPTKPYPLPLLVFVHGLGGSLAQFHPILTTLTNVGPCFGIDFPGCGLSTFSPKSWSAYSVEALATLLATAIERHLDTARNQQVIFIGHSLGCSIATLIASSISPIAPQLKEHIIGFIALCPQATPPSKATTSHFRRLLHIPESIFNAWRKWDRRGGLNSPSVLRFTGSEADIGTRKLQLRFNEQSRTPTWRRMAWGTLPEHDASGKTVSGIPGEEMWKGIQVPLLLVAGESDPITKPIEVSRILEYFSKLPDTHKSACDEIETGTGLIQGHLPKGSTNGTVRPSLSATSEIDIEFHGERHSEKAAVRSFIFPAPASHALLYDRATYRALSGLIQGFLANDIDSRLGIGWQLQHLTTSGKWDVKNLAKWKAVEPVSKPIGDTFFALKTLRELDQEHSPIPFVQKWKGRIFAIIDISHESPVYNPSQLDNGGIQYHKLPTVSKIPPTVDEVHDFVALVDRLEEEISSQVKNQSDPDAPRPLIGVHCHYGFNRTGFFLTSYLIERKGYTVEEALEEFKRCRPPGIRHPHFIDTLFVRYCAGLRGEEALSL